MIIPFIVQFGLYVCPVAYSSVYLHEKMVSKLGKSLGDQIYLLYSLNPMVGVIDGFRWAILGGPGQFYWPGFAVSVCLTILLLLVGIAYFRKTERAFADVI